MKIDPRKIAEAREKLSLILLNDAEQLRLAHLMIQNVFGRIEPMEDQQMCIAEGYLACAAHAVEQGQLLVEAWPYESLPADAELEPENRRGR